MPTVDKGERIAAVTYAVRAARGVEVFRPARAAAGAAVVRATRRFAVFPRVPPEPELPGGERAARRGRPAACAPARARARAAERGAGDHRARLHCHAAGHDHPVHGCRSPLRRRAVRSRVGDHHHGSFDPRHGRAPAANLSLRARMDAVVRRAGNRRAVARASRGPGRRRTPTHRTRDRGRGPGEHGALACAACAPRVPRAHSLGHRRGVGRGGTLSRGRRPRARRGIHGRLLELRHRAWRDSPPAR